MDFECPNCNAKLAVTAPEASLSITCPSCGSLLPAGNQLQGESLATSQGLEQFTLMERLGTGQFGSVWKAYDQRLNREVAIKLPREENIRPEDLDLFIREARAAAKLKHPNCVRVYEVGRLADSAYIVSELIDGVTLKDWVELHHPDPQQAVRVIELAARAIHHGHEQGVIHRDLKPSNILIDADGRPHITDFGLAKTDGAEFTIAPDGKVIGTLAYMPPEQAEGRAHEADGRADVYSLGVVLFEMLAGRRPFEGGSRVLLHKILFDDPPPLREVNPNIDVDLSTICEKALSKRPRDRYPSAAAFADDLQRYQSGEPIMARPRTMLRRAQDFAQKRAAAIAISVLSLLLVSGASAFFAVRPSHPPTAQPVVIETIPAGGKVYFVPLHTQNHEPKWHEIQKSGGLFSKTTWLLPGDYMVIAFDEIDGKEFSHVVLRHIPNQDDQWTYHEPSYPHTRWQNSEGKIKLPNIRLFENDAFAPGGDREMVSVNGGTFNCNYQYGQDHATEIASFYIDQNEHGTLVEWDWLPSDWAPWHGMTWPTNSVSWDEAVEICENNGKRLPSLYELEYLATEGGAFRSEQGPFQPGRWHPSPLDETPLDSTIWQTDRPVYNVHASLGEWTSTANLSFNKSMHQTVGLPFMTLGNPTEIRLSMEFDYSQPREVRRDERLGLNSTGRYRSIGFRGARDPSPRKLAEQAILLRNNTPPEETSTP